MDPIEWLNQVVGLGHLPPPDRKAISDFALLWSLFEGTMLRTHGSAAEIVAVVERLREEGRLRTEELAGPLAFWRHRYFQNGQFTANFEDLRFRANDRRALVEEVIAGKSDGQVHVATALLIIVFRLRNNLFHGIKWAYKLEGQRPNFENANVVLMQVMQMNGPQERPAELAE